MHCGHPRSLLVLRCFGSKRGRAAWLSWSSCGITCSVISRHSSLRDESCLKAYSTSVWVIWPAWVMHRTTLRSAMPWRMPQNKTPECGKTSEGICIPATYECQIQPYMTDAKKLKKNCNIRHIPSVILMLIRSSLFVSTFIWDLRRLRSLLQI